MNCNEWRQIHLVFLHILVKEFSYIQRQFLSMVLHIKVVVWNVFAVWRFSHWTLTTVYQKYVKNPLFDFQALFLKLLAIMLPLKCN